MMFKPIAGSHDPSHRVPAFFSAQVSESGLEGVNSSIFEELRQYLQKKNEDLANVVAVHGDYVDQLDPLLRLIKDAQTRGNLDLKSRR